MTEVSDLKVSEYNHRPSWHSHNREILHSLTPVEYEFAKRMDLVIVRGKSTKNEDAFILLTPDATQGITKLIANREMVGVPLTNPYVFARLNANTPVSGTLELKNFVSEVEGLKRPDLITTTKLRKYIASVCQVCSLLYMII